MLRVGSSELRTHPVAARNAREAGPQDFIIVTVKSTAIGPGFGAEIAPIVSLGTTVLFVANALPWWYFEKVRDRPTVDHPFFNGAGQIMRNLSVATVLGGVAYSANSVTAPGEIVNNSPGRNRLHFASIVENSTTEAAVEDLFSPTAFEALSSENILEEVWRKLLVSMCAPPLCIAAGVLPRDIAADPALRAVFACVVAEAHAVASVWSQIQGNGLPAACAI